VSSRPRVSILIPTYNRADYLPQAIRSALAQTYQDFELLILDDASTDRSPESVRGLLADRRVVYIKHPINLGISANRNSGIARSKGEYLAMLDSDDLWIEASKLQRQVDVLDADPDCGLVGTHARVLDDRGVAIGTLRPRTDPDGIRRAMLVRNQIVHSSVLLRRRALDRAGWYDTSLPIWEDYELWLRMGAVSRISNLPLFLTGYRRHAGNTSRFAEEKSLISYRRIYERHRHRYPHAALLGMKVFLLGCQYHLQHPRDGRRRIETQ